MLTGPGHLCLLCIDNLTQSSAFTFQSPAHGLRSSPNSQMHGNSLLSISTGSLIEVSNLACSKCSSCFKPTTPVPFPVFLTSLSNSSIYPVASTQKPSSQTLIPLFLLPISLSSVQFSRSVVPNSLWPHGLQHARPPCPSPTPGVCPNSGPLSRWYYTTISSSVSPFSSRFQSFPASGSFPMSQLFASDAQSIGISASTSVLQWTPRTDFL